MLKEVPQLMSAKYDNTDMAYALNIHNFPDFRKNLERELKSMDIVCNLPRFDDSQTRPVFRLAHAYDYALTLEFMRWFSRAKAGVVVGVFLREMGHGASERMNRLDQESIIAIMSEMNRYMSDSAVVSPAERGRFVDFPWLEFDPLVLDRSAERQADPLLWITPDDGRHAVRAMLASEFDFLTVCAEMTEELRRINLDPSVVQPVRSVAVVNVTSLLSAIDHRLSVRLHARKLRGE